MENAKVLVKPKKEVDQCEVGAYVDVDCSGLGKFTVDVDCEKWYNFSAAPEAEGDILL